MLNLPSPLQVSKWVKIPMLLDMHEMEDLLFHHTPPFKLYDVQKVVDSDGGIYQPEQFLKEYEKYIGSLKNGEMPLKESFRSFFSHAWSVTEDAFYAIKTPDGRRLFKAMTPVVQTQPNQMRYVPEEKNFRTQVFGTDTICWGIQIGFPHLFLNPNTYEATHTREFPNMVLFNAIQKWIRSYTLPTPFVIEGEKINSPIRIGKACFSWIASHPQLKANGIIIHGKDHKLTESQN